MATSSSLSRSESRPRAVLDLLELRPLIALAAALFTTTGHTMNLRELAVAQGWVTAEIYTLQSAYLISLTLMLVLSSTLARRFSCRALAITGLGLVIAGSLVNGLATWAPTGIFLVGRMLAGSGCGVVIYFAPRLISHRWAVHATWAAILLPAAGPGVISAATTLIRGVSDWEWGFLFEGCSAFVGLLALVSMAETPETYPAAPRGSLSYLPPLLLAIVALFYVLHWGQLQGWLESSDIILALGISVCGLAVSLWLAWPQLDLVALKENWIRLVVFFFGGINQFLHSSYTMNTYGGSIINLSSWQRGWLIWPMPIGIAVSLALSQLRWRHYRLPLRLPGAAFGLLLLATGLYLSYRQTIEWPYWEVRSTADLNWFPAPSIWQLAPARLLIGMGVGLFMVAMDTFYSPDPDREEEVRPFLMVLQFFGGACAVPVLVNFLLIGHAVHYSYAADRDFIQAGELSQRQAALSSELQRSGQASPDRAAEVLMYRSVNYEADNLVFASIYVAFSIASVILAGLCLGLWAWSRLPPESLAFDPP